MYLFASCSEKSETMITFSTFFDMSFQEHVKTRFLNFEKKRKVCILEHWWRDMLRYKVENRSCRLSGHLGVCTGRFAIQQAATGGQRVGRILRGRNAETAR